MESGESMDHGGVNRTGQWSTLCVLCAFAVDCSRPSAVLFSHRRPEGTTALTAPDVIARLVERFSRNRDSYTGLHYKEAQLRAEFLDPLFEALGWDVTNKQGWAEAYKDVVQEDAVRIGGAMKAPDYAFRVGGVRKFFVEAKKPAVKIREDAEAAYQLRRYAWSAKLPLSILTNFEELAVYDCRFKPAPGDKASAARVLLCSCTEYVARWDEIAAIFARDSLLRGSFDKYAETNSAKRGTAADRNPQLTTPSSSRSKAGATRWRTTWPCVIPI